MNKNKIIGPYLTRKNLIAISAIAISAVIFAFCGLCLCADGRVFSKANPILAIANGMGYRQINVEAGSLTMVVVSILLVSVYIILLGFMLIYITRFAKINNIKYSLQQFLSIIFDEY